MKRFWILMAVLVLSCFPAFAEEIDISGMDLETKLALHARLDESIAEDLHCLLDMDTIYQGEYLVGKDIAPGRYLFTCNKDIDAQYDEDFAYWLYADKAAYESYDLLASDAVCFGRSLSVLLEEGMFLKIVQGQAQVELLPTADYAP